MPRSVRCEPGANFRWVPLQPVQTKRDIQALLASAGVRPRKRHGQNFLIDGNLMRRLAESAELGPRDVVLEVGPGTGGLTDLLLPRAGRVIAIEVDAALHQILKQRYAEVSNLTLLHGDVLARKHQFHADLEALLRECDKQSASVKLVANLPYQVATPVLMNLLVQYPSVRRLCFTVQAEVGARILAGPGTKAYGPLSIVTQSLCRVEQLARVPATAFWPQPKVESALLRLEVGPPPFATHEECAAFVRLVRATFDHRRKTLRSALGYVLEPAQIEQLARHFDTSRRPEAFTVAEWRKIFLATRAAKH